MTTSETTAIENKDPAAHDVPFPPTLRIGTFSLVWHRRPVLVLIGAIVAAACLIVAALALGEQNLSLATLVDVFGGGGSRSDRILVLDLRANRVLAATLAGCALGTAGAIMQSVTRNPLASPDILGITAGASVGAVTVIALSQNSDTHRPWVTPIGALVGGLAVAAAIALVSRGMDSLRMVLSGIAFSALCTAAVTYTLTVVPTDVAGSAFAWLAGSLNDRNAENLVPVAVALGLAVPVLLAFARVLDMLSLGPVRAVTLGVPVAVGERVLLLTSVVLASAATAAVGPIGFVAFVAPQIARRIAATTAPPLITSGVLGAFFVVGADTLIRSVLTWQPPIGAATSVLGAPVLIYFLWKATRA
ncbi:MAG: iron ABC transporter permease [Gordonia sp. (in: high G+C Gram-positive bacteria)]